MNIQKIVMTRALGGIYAACVGDFKKGIIGRISKNPEHIKGCPKGKIAILFQRTDLGYTFDAGRRDMICVFIPNGSCKLI